MQLTILTGENINFSEGDVITIKIDNYNMFLGYIFTKNIIDNIFINITAYDSIRYLITRDTYIYKNKTASQILNMICADFSLKTGTIEETGYNIPYRIEENQLILDILYTAIDLTKAFNNKSYILFDDFGKISLKSYDSMKLPILIDCDNFILGIKHKTSIDENVYNSIKVSLKNKKTKVISTYLEEDENNKQNWGVLRKFKRLPNDFNSVQAKNYAKNLLNIHNKLNEEIEVVCFADKKIRAGNLIDISLNKQIKNVLVKECVHFIKDGEHTMKLTLEKI